MADSVLFLSFAPFAAGRERAEAWISELLASANMGKIASDGEDLRTGAFSIEIATSKGEALFEMIQSALKSEPGLELEQAILFER